MTKKIAEKKIEIIFSCLIFFLSFAVYFRTAPRDIFLGDNAEFVTAIETWGVPHPSGYPLYLILAKIFSALIPGFAAILKINLFSAVLSSLSLVLLFLIGKKIAHRDENPGKIIPACLIIFSGIMLLAFSRIFWYQSIVGKTYPLNLFFSLLLLYLLMLYREKNASRIFYAISLLAGLSLANHQIILLFIPFALIELSRPFKKISFKKILIGACLFFLGLSAYLYLPLLSRAEPPLDWGRTGKSFKNFICHASRCSYGDYLNEASFFDKNLFFLSFGADAAKQLGPYLFFCLFGFWFFLKSEKKSAYLILALILSNSLFLILIRSSSYNEESRQFYSAYYLPAYSLLALVSSLGLVYLWRRGGELFNKKIFAGAFFILIFFPGALELKKNYRLNNFRHYRFLGDYSAGILNSLEPNAVLGVSVLGPEEDSYLFSLLYQKAVKKIRPDVTVVSYIDIFKQADPETVNGIFKIKDEAEKREALVAYIWKKFGNNRPVYSSFNYFSGRLITSSNGLAYRIYERGYEKKEKNYSLAISDNDGFIMENDFFGREVLANYYLAQASAAQNKKGFSAAEDFFIKSIRLNNFPFDIDQLTYLNLREKK